MDVAKPKAIIIDIDGTLALRLGRGPFDWNRVGEDLPNWPIVALVKTHCCAPIQHGMPCLCPVAMRYVAVKPRRG